jgi:ribosomal-protein-alanine N-acetyltransferase
MASFHHWDRPSMHLPEHITVIAGRADYRPRGDLPGPEAVEAMLAALLWCRDQKIGRLMADVRGVPRVAELDTMARFDLGRRGAELARGQVRVAVVMTVPQVDPERFGESVARNRGLDAAVFTDEVAALTWLEGPNAIRPVLKTERLALRWLTPDDAPFIFELTTQPTWLANIGDRGVRDIATAEGYIQNGPRASYAARGYGLWCVTRKEDGVPIGMCGVIKRDTMELPELAYAYLERFHGRGYGAEAAVATVTYAKDMLGLRRLSAIVNPGNVASIKVLERVGMRYLGPIQMPGDLAPISHYTT